MIFASVGSMLPFDRLTQAIDDWAARNPAHDVFIQIGAGAYEPRHAPWVRSMAHQEYRQRLEGCDLFVAHVGMGSILQALELQKQMLLMPRQQSLREHTTEHQLHTADKFRNQPGIVIVDEVADLQAAISRLISDPLQTADALPRFAPETLTARIAHYLNTGVTLETEA